MFSVCTFGYSWPKPLQVKIKKNREHTMAENMGLAPTLWYICDGAHYKGGTNTAHLI